MATARVHSIASFVLLPLVACSSDSSSTTDLFDGYASSALVLPTRLSIADLVPLNAAAAITEFSISPDLPEGLAIDPVTGVISGAPAGLSPTQTYTVSATDGTVSDSEALSLTVRAPIVGLVSSRELVVTEMLSGSPIAPSGMGVGLGSGAPTATTPALVAVDMPQASTAAVVPFTDLSMTAPGVAPGFLDASVDFVATITVDDSELAAADTWQFSVQAPYDDDGLAPGLPGFTYNTASVVTEDGALGLDVELPAESLGPFDSGTLTTELRSIEPLTSGLVTMDSSWVELDGAYYAQMQEGSDFELYRYDPDGGVGGVPSFGLAADVDAAADTNAEIRATVAGRLIVDMRDSAGARRLHAYDPATDELAQVSELGGGGGDNSSSFLEFDGAMYFVGSDSMGLSSVYRYNFGAEALERISDTAGAGMSDSPQDLRGVDGMVYFLADDTAGDRHLYRFDPIFMTQEKLSDDTVAPLNELTSSGGRIFVIGRNSQDAQKLFLFEPVSGELRQIANTAGDDSLSDDIAFRFENQGDLYFVSENPQSVQKLYRYSESSGSGVVEQVTSTAIPTITDAIGTEFLLMGDQLFFVALNSTSAIKLFSLDLGTGVATQICNINTTDVNDNPSGFRAVGTTRMAFVATIQPVGHTEVFEYDLESGETKRLADINVGANDDASTLAVIDGELVFRATDSGGGVRAYVVR